MLQVLLNRVDKALRRHQSYPDVIPRAEQYENTPSFLLKRCLNLFDKASVSIKGSRHLPVHYTIAKIRVVAAAVTCNLQDLVERLGTCQVHCRSIN